MMDPSAYPHELAEALWKGIWIFGSAIASMAVAFSLLAWWSIKRSDRQAAKCEERAAALAKECQEKHEESEARLMEQVRANHGAAIAYAESNAKIAEALKFLRIQVLGVDVDNNFTPEPQILPPLHLHMTQQPLSPHLRTNRKG